MESKQQWAADGSCWDIAYEKRTGGRFECWKGKARVSRRGDLAATRPPKESAGVI
jgi:hypothetical protein